MQPKTSGFNSSKADLCHHRARKSLVNLYRKREKRPGDFQCRLISDKTRRGRMRDDVRHATRKYNQTIRYTLSVGGAAKMSYVQVNILPLERWKGADLIATAL